MTRPARFRSFALVLALFTAWSWPGYAYLSPQERQNLQLPYTVKDRNGSFFDVQARIETLKHTNDPLLIRLRERRAIQVSCRQMKEHPVLDGELTMPSFFEHPDEWDLTSQPLLDFERTMSNLSAAWVASGDPYYANCLVDILETWAKRDALSGFLFRPEHPQAWFALESMIFSAALAYSTVTGEIKIAPARRKTIDSWLMRIARHHFYKYSSSSNCCNNHYYRRALYMTMIGVETGNDEMFQTGLKAVYSALEDIDDQGAFKQALDRGWRAIHYQNYSLLYLVPIMQIAYRQGYNLFKLEVNGHRMQNAAEFLLKSLDDPYSITGLPPGEQDLDFTNDPQYFAWMEMWLRHEDDPPMARFVRQLRPIFNRGAGGDATLFFKSPENPRITLRRDFENFATARMTEAELGGRYPVLEKWRRSQ